MTDPDLNVTTWNYDELGRLTSEVAQAYDPGTQTLTTLGTRSYLYDANGNVTQYTDRDGRVIQYTYDTHNNMIKEQWLDGSTVVHTLTYTYDVVGNLIATSDDESSASYTLTYDSLNRLTSTDVSLPGMPSTATDVKVTDQYDAAGNRTVLRTYLDATPDFWNQYTYDHLNRVVDIAQNGTIGTNKSVGLAYDDAGNLMNLYRYNQVVANPADPNDPANNSVSPLATSTYSRDESGRLLNLDTDLAGSSTQISYSWQYDHLNRVTYTSSSIDASHSYSYDFTNQLTEVTGGTSESYTYNLNGNRTSTDGTTNQPEGGNRLESDGTYDYYYDAEGNLTQQVTIATGDTRVFTYDYRNRLIDVTDHTGSATGTVIQDVTYTYDTFDRRVSRTLDSNGDGYADEIENYIYDGDHVIFDFVDPDGTGSAPMALKHRYLYGPAVDQILAQEDADASPTSANRVLWFLGDEQHTTHDLIDNTGTAVTGGHYLYDSFGTVINTSGADTSLTRYLYTGRELDTATDLQYNRERWYDSSTGRWLSEDPLGFDAGDSNLYRYVWNAPTDGTDPAGEDRRVMFFGHSWIEVDIYDATGRCVGAVELHFSPSGYDNVPRGSTYPPLPISVWESTPEQDRELIELWESLEQQRQSNGWLSYTGVYNCWIPTWMFIDYGSGPGPYNHGWENQGHYGDGGFW